VLENGKWLTVDANCVRPPLMDLSENNIRSGALLLFLFGYVRYRDKAGTVREMGFGRKFNPTTDRFDLLNDPEVEYGD
jgi:hypothetical protein